MPKQAVFPSRLPEEGEREDGRAFPKIELVWTANDPDSVRLRLVHYTETRPPVAEVVDELPLSVEGLSHLLKGGKQCRRQAFQQTPYLTD